MKSIITSRNQQINAQGVFSYPGSGFIVRVKIKHRYHTLITFKKEQDAVDYYENWLKENTTK